MFYPKPLKRFNFFLLACFFIFLPSKALLAQNQPQPQLDLLLKKLGKALSGTNKVNLLDKITNYYLNTDKQKPLLYGTQELDLSAHLGWVKGQIMAYNDLADIYYNPAAYQKALDFYKKGYELAVKNKLIYLQYRMLRAIGDVEMQIRNFNQGIADLKKSMEYFQLTKDVEAWAYSAYMIGLGYARQNKDSSALNLYQQILDKYIHEKDTPAIRQAVRNLGLYYSNFRNIPDSALRACIVGVKKFAYDIWGDTVNTAARMEQHSVPGQINLPEKTYELVKDQFAFT